MSTTAFNAGNFARSALQSIALLLIIVTSTMAMVKPVNASGTVSVSPIQYQCLLFHWVWGHRYLGTFSVSAATVTTGSSNPACIAACASVNSTPTSIWDTACKSGHELQGYYSGGSCPSNSTGSASMTTCTCNTGFVPDPAGTNCVPEVTACPDNASRMSPDLPCTCNTDYQFDAAGTSCVRKCPVTKLDVITDPVAQKYDDGTYSTTNPDIEHITPETLAGLDCIKQKVIATNCNRTPQATSGYRPAAYQTHIYDVYTKWQKIKDNNTPECAEVKAAIKVEFADHSKFYHAPGKTSNHSQTDAQGNPAGTAVDIAFVPDNAFYSADAIACQCNMARTVPNDSVHYQPRTCPR